MSITRAGNYELTKKAMDEARWVIRAAMSHGWPGEEPREQPSYAFLQASVEAENYLIERGMLDPEWR